MLRISIVVSPVPAYLAFHGNRPWVLTFPLASKYSSVGTSENESSGVIEGLYHMDIYNSIVDVYNNIVHMHQYIQDPTNMVVA